jgi:hypothetical protein
MTGRGGHGPRWFHDCRRRKTEVSPQICEGEKDMRSKESDIDVDRQEGLNGLEDINIGQWPTHTLTAHEALDELSTTHPDLLHLMPQDGRKVEHIRGGENDDKSAHTPPPRILDGISLMYTVMERHRGPVHIQELD